LRKEISAGGVVYRKEGKQTVILMIEDRYHRVTIPKGKQEKGETLAETALREIEEETGIQGEIVKPLSTVHYTYTDPERGQIDKEVSYFLVKAQGGQLKPQLEEINRVFWVDLQEVMAIQDEKGYENNRQVFQQALIALQ
jgi:diadenosine hexaphosphate hydrolase (ATP-forming)